jgi:hypothetical protein
MTSIALFLALSGIAAALGAVAGDPLVWILGSAAILAGLAMPALLREPSIHWRISGKLVLGLALAVIFPGLLGAVVGVASLTIVPGFLFALVFLPPFLWAVRADVHGERHTQRPSHAPLLRHA